MELKKAKKNQKGIENSSLIFVAFFFRFYRDLFEKQKTTLTTVNC